MDQRISVITLGVQDLQKTREFYDLLGWKVATEENTENIVAYNLPGFTICLYQRDNLADDIKISSQGSGFPGFTLAYNVASKEEVDRILSEAVDAGAKLVKSAQDVFWGGYSGYFSDPNGFYWEVAFNPFSALGPGGEFQWGGVVS